MEHARKMVLVPEDNLSQFSTQNHRQPAFSGLEMHPHIGHPIATALNRLDAEMKDILSSTSYRGEREKWSAYQAVLQRYLHFIDDERTQLPPVQRKERAESPKNDKKEREREKEHLASLNDSVIVESVPQKFRHKAKLLLRRLHETPATSFSWDSAGVVSISGKSIKDSNIIDLMNDAMRARKIPTPAGRQKFARFLRAIQTPREFIGNDNLWREARANSTLRRATDEGNDNDDDDDDNGVDSVSSRSHSTFFSGSDNNNSDHSVQSGAGCNNKKRRLTWANLKL